MGIEKSGDLRPTKQVAIYVRVSDKKQLEDVGDQNSIDNQIKICEQVIELKNATSTDSKYVIQRIYRDIGSGKDRKNRPQFNRMMEEVHNGTLHVVLSKELSRISRSVSDFLKIYTELEDNKVDLVCYSQQIDTGTSAGKFMTLLLVQLAQFEREQLAERVSDSVVMRSNEGKWTGGSASTRWIYARQGSKRIPLSSSSRRKESKARIRSLCGTTISPKRIRSTYI